MNHHKVRNQNRLHRIQKGGKKRMKKFLLITFIVIFSTVGLVSNSFGEQPKYGGILTRINPTGARVIGYYPEMGPQDSTEALPVVECLMEMSEKRTMEPFLAERVDIDQNKKTMTFRLRKGIKFHDGSDLNAEVCAWNLQLVKDTKKMQFADQVKSIEVVDDYTVVLHLTQYHNQMRFAYGFTRMFSKAAYEKYGKEWCRTHPVATGAFKFVEWKRDAYLKYEKFDGYWQKGKPYLDGIETRYIPDPVTASAMIQAKEADIWTNPPVKFQYELEKKGFKRYSSWPALPILLYLNTKDPNRPTSKLKVREAIEYAIDKPAMAKAIGFGYYPPLKMVTPETEWGYDSDYPGRPYNPEKARKLLAEAGYPQGVKLKLLALAEVGGRNNTAEAVKAYLDEAGMTVDLDIADPGRFFSSVWGNGWDDLALFFSGLDENYLGTFHAWFGHEPKTSLASFKLPDELSKMSKESITYYTEAEQKAITKKLVRSMMDHALAIPLYNQQVAYIYQPWVHTTYLQTGFIRWKWFDTWMEKH